MKRIFIIFTLIAILCYVLFLFLLFFRNNPTQVTKDQISAPTSFPSVFPSTTPSSFHSALPQIFPSGDQHHFGTLEVTSTPDGAKVMLDTSADGDASATNTPPVNYTPFIVRRMPVGTYTLFASKSGYNFTNKTFSIIEGQTTQVSITLDPL